MVYLAIFMPKILFKSQFVIFFVINKMIPIFETGYGAKFKNMDFDS
jgi:hypothetical protein